jgi:predicted permease
MADIRHAVRMLFKRPAFTLVAALTLALGIGANTAIFSVVNGVLLRPLPYSEPGRIVRIFEQSPKSPRNGVSNPNFLDWRERATSFDALAAFGGGAESVLGGTEPVFAQVFAVSEGFFRVLGVNPEIGRTFAPDEMRVGGVPAVVVSRGFWERTLGARRDLSALRVIIDGQSARVVGVMPASFNYPVRAEVWFPKELANDTSGRTAHNWSVIARLRPGVTLAAAAAEMNAIAAALKQQHGNGSNAIAAATVPLQDVLAGGSRDSLLLLLGAVGLVLLIACANVATTILARGEERRTELAVRSALGAGRARLVRQLLAESLVLGLLGACGGLLLAAWLVRALTSIDAAALPRYAAVGIDTSVLLYTLALALVTPLLFGLVPSLQVSRGDLRDALAEGGRSAVAPSRARVRSGLVAAEVAVALLLLVGASLLIRSFVNVMSVDPGFQVHGSVVARMAVPAARYSGPEPAARFYSNLLERLRALPGVVAAGATNQLPLAGLDFGGAFTFEGTPDAGSQADGNYDGFRYSAGYRASTPGYLEALGVRLVQGRLLAESDREGQPPAAVVNESFVKRFLPRANPIGVRFRYAGMDRVNPTFMIVGVVADIRHRSLVADTAPEAFVCLYQAPLRAQFMMTTLVRAATPDQTAAVAAAVRETIRQFDSDVPVEMATLDSVLADSVASRRFLLIALGTFAAIALLLAATGIYSVLSQSVAQRTQEIGIRMALGADARSVIGLMLGTAMRSVGLGIAIGAVAGLASVRLLTTYLFGVAPLDPAAFVGAAALLALVALGAAYIPARRATRVDPLLALRAQ